MIHYEKGEKETVKYDVTIDFEELRKIRNIVLNRCTEATKVSYKGTERPVPRVGETIADLRSKLVCRETRMPSAKEVPVYRYRYISYQAPRLVYLIDQLMDGNIQVIDELQSPQEMVTNKEKIENAINSMFPIQATTNFDRLTSYIREYKEHISLNKSRLQSLEQSEVLSYYPKVLDCIQMREVERISNQDFDGVAQFLMGELQSVLDELAFIKQDLYEEDVANTLQEQTTGVQKRKEM